MNESNGNKLVLQNECTDSWTSQPYECVNLKSNQKIIFEQFMHFFQKYILSKISSGVLAMVCVCFEWYVVELASVRRSHYSHFVVKFIFTLNLNTIEHPHSINTIIEKLFTPTWFNDDSVRRAHSQWFVYFSIISTHFSQ